MASRGRDGVGGNLRVVRRVVGGFGCEGNVLGEWKSCWKWRDKAIFWIWIWIWIWSLEGVDL